MSKKKKTEARKEEPKAPASKPWPWQAVVATIFGSLILLNMLVHPGQTVVTSQPSAPAPGPTVVRVEKLIWLPNDFGQKELYPIIYENGQEVVLRNDRLRGGRVTTQTSSLLSPTSSDYRYTVP